MKFHVLKQAQIETLQAAIWYDDHQPSLGADFLADVEYAFEVIRTNANSLPPLETYHGRHDIRRVLLHRFPYAALVLLRTDEAIVLAMAHARRLHSTGCAVELTETRLGQYA